MALSLALRHFADLVSPFPSTTSAVSASLLLSSTRPQTADTDTETPRTPKSQRVVRALDVEGDSEDAHLLKWLRWIRAAEYDKATRSMAAEWLVFYHQKVWNEGERFADAWFVANMDEM